MKQKVEYYSNSQVWTIAKLIQDQIDLGWFVKAMMADNGCCIVVYEKQDTDEEER